MKILSVVIFMAIQCIANLSYAETLKSEQFSISVKTDKEKYYPYEPIIIKVCITNDTDSSISVPPIPFNSFGNPIYNILGPDKNRIKIISIRREDLEGKIFGGVNIKPKEFSCQMVDINYYFNMSAYGKYRFRFIYNWEYKYYKLTDVFKLDDKSYKIAECTFEIIPPEDEKEREALKELDPLMQKYYITNTYPVDTREDVILGFERFIEKYPESIYAELASISRIDYLEEFYYVVIDNCPYILDLDNKARWRMLNEELEKHSEKYKIKRYTELYNKKKLYYPATLGRAIEGKLTEKREDVLEAKEAVKTVLYNVLKDSKVSASYKEHVKPEALKLQEAAEAKRARNKKITIALIFLGILILIGGAVLYEYYPFTKRRGK